MDTASSKLPTWLIVAAEAREFDGIVKRASNVQPLQWPAAQFAKECEMNGQRWLLIANGPGPRLVHRALATRPNVDGMMSVGFCGALDPALQVGDIVVSGETPKGASSSFAKGEVLSIDRVISSAAEKQTLRATNGAAVVEMESAAVAQKAGEWGVAYRCVRVVSDASKEDMPLDFNRYRDADGRFSRTRIAMAALARPFTALPRLMQLDRNCRLAAERLGVFLADCQL